MLSTKVSMLGFLTFFSTSILMICGFFWMCFSITNHPSDITKNHMFDYIENKAYSTDNHMTLGEYKFDFTTIDTAMINEAKRIVAQKKQEKVEIDEKAELLKRNDLMSILANVTLTDGYTNRKINLETMSEDLSDAEIEQLAYYMIETMKTMRNHRNFEKRYMGDLYKFKDKYNLDLQMEY